MKKFDLKLRILKDRSNSTENVHLFYLNNLKYLYICMEIYTQVISKIYNVNNNIFYANKARVIWTKIRTFLRRIQF